jgi:bifunctional enzyme CysN/CysC
MLPLLRFLTAGSVDDGKSTLIGRLLVDTATVYDDQLAAVRRVSAHSAQGLDLAFITDGLRAEREQGITIDVAYRHFRTPRRRFLIIDAPGHEQYTRNMAAGASHADLVLLLLDARKGVLEQSCRHAHLAALLGIRRAVVAVNKMDLAGYSRAVYQPITEAFSRVLTQLNFDAPSWIPVSALQGDNVITRSPNLPWYDGPTLLEYLETVHIPQPGEDPGLRFPVQYVIRSDHGARGYAGRLESGRLRANDPVTIWPSGQQSTIAAIETPAGLQPEVAAPAAVVVRLTHHIDLGRGDLLAAPAHPPQISRAFRASLVWMTSDPLRCQQPYLLKHQHRQVCASVKRIHHRIEPHTLLPVESQELRINDIAEVEIETHQPLCFDPYEANKSMGSFILMDLLTNATVAAGMIHEPRHDSHPAKPARPAHRGLTVWFTGLSASGKSTISRAVQAELEAQGYRTELLDGDIVRQHLSKGLGFSREDRDENIRRIGFVAGLLTRNGVIALVAAISPYRAIRHEVRTAIGDFLEVYVNAPLEVCESRDPKGLYKRARQGELKSFTGLDDPYEPPETPDLECRTAEETIPESAAKVLAQIHLRLQS